MLSIFHGKHPNSYFRVPEFDAMVEAAEREGEPARRRELAHKALEYFREEAPILFLHQQVDLYSVNRRVSGWVPFPDQRIAVQSVDLSQ
jgi:peptide/nickel transport system substrate-binding protein